MYNLTCIITFDTFCHFAHLKWWLGPTWEYKHHDWNFWLEYDGICHFTFEYHPPVTHAFTRSSSVRLNSWKASNFHRYWQYGPVTLWLWYLWIRIVKTPEIHYILDTDITFQFSPPAPKSFSRFKSDSLTPYVFWTNLPNPCKPRTTETNDVFTLPKPLLNHPKPRT